MSTTSDQGTPQHMPPSVYERVLGERFALLDPALQRYFGPIPPGMAGQGCGVYEFAGTERIWLRPVLRWMAWRRILFPERGRDVPFTVVNTGSADGGLTARRTFIFPTRTRLMQDSLAVVDGQLVDRLGRRRGLEVGLEVEVRGGGLQMVSAGLHLHLFGIRIALPRVATMTLDERTHPSGPGRQHVDVTITSPGIGVVFRYHGSFTYELATLPPNAGTVALSEAGAPEPGG